MAAPEQAEKRHEHFALAKAPDWKYTPLKPDKGVPVPYWTISYFDESVKTANRSDGRTNEYFLDRSRVPVSRGGEAGKGKGVMSGTYMDEFEPKEWSQTLHIDGGLAVFNGHTGTINKGNAPAKVYTSINPEQAIADKACWEQMKTNMAALGVASKDRMFADPAGCGKDVLSGAWNTITGDVAAVGDMLGSVWGGIKAFFSDPLGSMGSAVDGLQKFGTQAVEAGKQVVGVINGLRDGSITMDDLLDFAADMLQDQLCEIAAQVEEMVKQGKGCEAVGVILGQTAEAVAVSLATAGVGAAAGGATKAAQLMAKAGITKGDDIAAAIRKLKEFKKKHKERPHEGGEPHPRRLADGEDSSTPGDGRSPPCVVCPLVAHPVNPVLGCKVLADGMELDFELPALMPLVWQRTYTSSNARSGWFGQGWALKLDARIETRRTPGGRRLVLIDEYGREVMFPLLAPGGRHYNEFEQFALSAPDADHLELLGPAGSPRLVFGKAGTRYLLDAIVDRNDNALRIRYGAQSLPVRIEDSAGRAFLPVFETLAGGAVRIRRVALERTAGQPPVTLVTYDYSAEGDLVRVVDRSGHVAREFEYIEHMMVSHTRPDGMRVRYEYDVCAPRGKVLRCDADNGESYRFEYAGRETRVRDQLGRVEVYEFNQHREWIGTVDAMGGRTRRELDAFGMLLAQTDPAGRTRRYAYDGQGRPTRIQEPGPTAQESLVTWVAYDDRLGLPSRIVDPAGATIEHRHDERGNVVATVDALGQETRYAYDGRGLPVEIVDALGKTRRMAYDAAGRIVRHVDCSGLATSYAYDDWGYLASVTDPLGQTTSYRHDSLGRLLSVQYADGACERQVYDAAGRLVEHVDALGRRTEYQLAVDGLPVLRRNALGHELRYEYDKARRLVALYNENAVRHDFVHDALDRIVEETGFDGRHVRRRYDPSGLMLARIELGCLDRRQRLARRLALEQQREGAGRGGLPRQRSAPTYEDPWGFGLADEVAPSSALPGHAIVTHYERDAAGRLVRKEVAGHAVGPDGVSRPQFKVTRYRHDAAGRLVEAVNDAGSRSRFVFDAVGQLIEESRTGMGPEARWRHRYDPLGHRVSTLLPDGRTLNWLHYGSGHLHQVNIDGRVVCDIERDSLHRETARSQGRLHSRYRYDAAGRLAEQTAWAAEAQAGPDGIEGPSLAVLRRRYAYDRAGNLSESMDARHGAVRYAYDPVGRLLAAAQPDLAERFAFDPAGNLLAADAPAGSSAGLVRDNRVEVFEDKRYRYDSHGNVIEKRIGKHTAIRFEWDVEHRLQRTVVTRGGDAGAAPLVTHYAYDAFGRRIRKTDRFGQTLFDWDGNRLCGELRGSRRIVYLYEGDGFVPLAQIVSDASAAQQPPAMPAAPVAADAAGDEEWQPRKSQAVFMERMLAQQRRIRAVARGEAEAAPDDGKAHDDGQTGATVARLADWRARYYHNDHLGTPRELSSEAGEILWRTSYKAWGNTWRLEQHAERLAGQEEGEVVQNLRFQGQYRDDETGLHYNRFRYYDPDCGRFASQDPMGLSGGINLFAYAPNPTGWVDPLGLVDIKHFPSHESICGFADLVPDNPKRISVGGHGTPLHDCNNVPLTVQEIADEIRAHSKYKKGMGVDLLSCSTGAGSASYAQQLANELGATVRAPDTLLWYYSNGALLPAPRDPANPALPDTKNPGTMRRFKPQKRHRRCP
ncbi:RHS repeat-associated core domain-containing protein [Variovorax paradoxus]|uniref:RHS repeat-associated core domain-containing protein n=1 Tax=Variovorax paradoxus TaxID=34073 RepID=UPI00193429A3|nr:RHS repeat protein [Variovorax paradoxus]